MKAIRLNGQLVEQLREHRMHRLLSLDASQWPDVIEYPHHTHQSLLDLQFHVLMYITYPLWFNTILCEIIHIKCFGNEAYASTNEIDYLSRRTVPSVTQNVADMWLILHKMLFNHDR
jgi:hypothetical protein